MAETTVLKSSASPAKPPSPAHAPANAFVEKSGPLPKVNVMMGSGGRPQVQGRDNLSGKSNVQVFPVKGKSGTPGAALSGSAIVAQRGALPPVIVDHRSGKPAVQQSVQVSSAQVAPMMRPAQAPQMPALACSKEELGFLRFLVTGFVAEQGSDPARADARELAQGLIASIDAVLASDAVPATRPPVMRRVVSAAPTSKISASAAPRRSVVQDVHVPPQAPPAAQAPGVFVDGDESISALAPESFVDNNEPAITDDNTQA